MPAPKALYASFADAWLIDGVRTPFVDYNGALSLVSPTDLAIKAARAVFEKSALPPEDVGIVVAGNMAQASFDAYMLPRHVGLYSGVPEEVPAHMVQRVCGTGIEVIMQASDAVSLGRADLALCVGAESMSRNPVASYTSRGGFRMGQVEFKDFLWEALLDPSCGCTMGDTAENLARRHGITREDTDAFAARSFARAVAAEASGFLAGEIVALENESFAREGLAARGIKLRGKDEAVTRDSHIRPSPLDALAKIRPAFGGVQTGGNSSAVVDGAAAALVGSSAYAERQDVTPLARIRGRRLRWACRRRSWASARFPRSARLWSGRASISTAIDRFEINEAFGAQCLACARELRLDEERLNVNGGAIAIGHPLGATGVRLTVTLARELKRSGGRYGIASACIGGGQGIALLIENMERD